jgi:hypothetical protein
MGLGSLSLEERALRLAGAVATGEVESRLLGATGEDGMV